MSSKESSTELVVRPTLADRKQAAKAAIEDALKQHGCKLAAAPAFQPDGRGGFFVTCAISVLGIEERYS